MILACYAGARIASLIGFLGIILVVGFPSRLTGDLPARRYDKGLEDPEIGSGLSELLFVGQTVVESSHSSRLDSSRRRLFDTSFLDVFRKSYTSGDAFPIISVMLQRKMKHSVALLRFGGFVSSISSVVTSGSGTSY